MSREWRSRHATVPILPMSSPARNQLIDVTVVLLERALPSSSVAPIEIFSTAGVLWPMLHGQAPSPRFRVRTVSLDGRATKHFVPLEVQAEGAIGSIKHTDLIVLPTAELDLEDSTRANSPLVPWIRRLYMGGASIAAICTGVSVVAQAGLLDGKPATGNHSLGHRRPVSAEVPARAVATGALRHPIGPYILRRRSLRRDRPQPLPRREVLRPRGRRRDGEVTPPRDAAHLAVGLRHRAAAFGA